MADPLAVSGPFKLATAHDTAWSVLTDLADYTSTYLDVSLMSHITITNNKLWRTDESQTAV